ncbi:MAG TPA: MTH1187 family thiamine-binding protein [Salinivirgaceae bacterium]|nr:MTH1187 family thiamine-binding protein [Salinivirgaceae bacterium]
MSVLMEFAIFPTDKGDSVSQYVSKVISMLKSKNLSYQLTPMGTIVEVETMEEATDLLNRAHQELANDCSRIYCTAKFDIRKGKSNRMHQKIDSIKKKIGDVNT